ncbi:jacalin-related lectin 3-like [Quercus lobata]|uniref:Jacalin-type lectin domain-containing protein n=1 Tax=Quercus lobata TaxID=97700 RepID=A0A7N2QYE4_QUELO|nr:jacalin-related lectin 3-like [Quercus lobata]
MNYEGYNSYEKGYANMRLVVGENDEDYAFAPNNRVFNEFETKNKEFGTTEAFKGYSNMRQTDESMFQQNKYSGEYTEVAKSNSNMRQTNMRQIEDNMFQQNRFLGEYGEVVNGNSNMRQTNMRHTEDYMFQPKRFLGEYAEVAKGYSNMRQIEDNMLPPNRFVGEYVTNNKVYTGTAQIAKGSKVVSCGPWGGPGGMQFDDGSCYTGVREIQLTRSGGLFSIKVCYDRNGQAIWGNKNGGNGGLTLEKIRFEYPNEFLTHISGYYGSLIFRGPTIIKSITFHTNMKKYGPFGDEQGIPFSSGSKDGIIVGFHGRQGWFIHSIGVYVMEGKPALPRPPIDAFNMGGMRIPEVVSGPMQGPGPCGQGVLMVGMVKKPAPYGPVGLPAGMVKEPAPCGLGPWGGDGGQPWDDKVFTGIKKIFLTKGEAIYSIQIEYDCNGQSIWSVKHGCGNEGTPYQIQFEYPHEFLTSVSGYYGSVAEDECRKVIKSLTFYTNRRRYGPYGEESGTYFTSTKNEGKIIGFHGRAASYLYAIGVHIQPLLNDRVSREPKGCPPQYQFNFYQ